MRNFFKKIRSKLQNSLKKSKSYSIQKVLIILANLALLKSRKLYNEKSYLEDFEQKFYSQNVYH